MSAGRGAKVGGLDDTPKTLANIVLYTLWRNWQGTSSSCPTPRLTVFPGRPSVCLEKLNYCRKGPARPLTSPNFLLWGMSALLTVSGGGVGAVRDAVTPSICPPF
ncbi:hypothetical protein E2C01_073553 [Portunus trituberculatus]|uniref:Uncharacterized protein n=1 Tax=Portunus trituberculatus TaxID=210409 RepID=A0A5B7I0Y9_PORTR|nr:hypothetical protein [Portunus trituberculatus]